MTGSRNVLHLMVALGLASCGGEPAGNAMTNAAVPDGPMPAGAPPLPKPVASNCKMPKLDLRAARLDSASAAAFTDNFTVAFDKACQEGLLKDGPLVDRKAADPETLFVQNAPEANVPSLYFNPESVPPRMMFEAPFGSPPQSPSVEEIHEAIYCTVHGATEQEMNESGRCLVD